MMSMDSSYNIVYGCTLTVVVEAEVRGVERPQLGGERVPQVRAERVAVRVRYELSGTTGTQSGRGTTN